MATAFASLRVAVLPSNLGASSSYVVEKREQLRAFKGLTRNEAKKLSSSRRLVRRIEAVVTGDSNTLQYAKEMERVSAKEALVLSIRDAGGVEALSSSSSSSSSGSSKIEVSERVLALERLNPTPRPTTSPMLEGQWDFLWAGATSPGLMAAKILLQRFPEQIAALTSLSLYISQGGAAAMASVRLLNTITTSVTLTTKLTMFGPARLREEYVEGVLSTPSVDTDQMPSPLKSVYDQIAAASGNLPDTVKDAIKSGVKVPLTGYFQRDLVISYLDDEIMVARDQNGVPDVLVRTLNTAPSLDLEGEVMLEPTD